MTSTVQEHAQRNRNTICVEDGEVLACEAFPGDQYVMRIQAPRCAVAAEPGSFVHLSCDETLPMRRPLSIMRVVDDCIEVLYKVIGGGLDLLARKVAGDVVNVLGPIGQPFRPLPERPNTLLIGGGVGIPPIVFLADALRKNGPGWRPFAILGSEIPFPFALGSSKLPVPGIDHNVTSSMALLEGWKVPSRLATLAGFEGCFHGYVTDLADRWLATLAAGELARTEIFACGPTPMLKTVTDLAQRYSVPCQVSLEEFMACAVGGCAGCTVLVDTPDGPAMKRVCVDGPVFDAATIIWNP